ncbi:hypothetical protein J132_01196 [Termitomyces sp. J132]|nr:hypothetical protein J132_01196 [Termitomyces sp. J132]
MDNEVFKEWGSLGRKAEVYDTELTGIARAMKAAREYADHNRRVKHVHIYADNTAAVTSVYKPKPKPGQLQMIRTTRAVDSFLEQDGERMVNIEWCPGHEEVIGNERADEEAKAEAEIRWVREWRRSPPSGGFAIANRLEPRWKPREHVTHTPREVFSRMTQCRTKHAFLGEYYARFVPKESNRCTCENCPQIREHVIKCCPKHESHRDLLREVDAQLELGVLLGTKKGLEALAKFLTKTGAFTKMGEVQKQRLTPREDDEENEEEEERGWDTDGKGVRGRTSPGIRGPQSRIEKAREEE